MQWRKVAHPWRTQGGRTGGGGGRWSYINWVIKEEGSPYAVKFQKGLLWVAAFTFFSVISLSPSLPICLCLTRPRSLRPQRTPEWTLGSRGAAGPIRIWWGWACGWNLWRNRGGFTTHLSAHGTPPPPRSPKDKRFKNRQHTHRDTLNYWQVTHTYSPCCTSTETQRKTMAVLQFKDNSCLKTTAEAVHNKKPTGQFVF